MISLNALTSAAQEY